MKMFSKFPFIAVIVIKQNRALLSYIRPYFVSPGQGKGLTSTSVPHRWLHAITSRKLLTSESSALMVPLISHYKHFSHYKCFKYSRTDVIYQSRFYSVSADKDTSTLLETWFYEVSPYGSLNARLPFQTTIQPLNPIDYPDMNKCIIELHYNIDATSDGILPSSHQLAQISDMYNLSVSFDKDKANMNLVCDVIAGVGVPVICYLRVPLKFDLSITTREDKSIVVKSMESNSISIEAEKGNITLQNIKSGSVSAASKSGQITSKSTLLGNVNLHCGSSGNISADKLQGSSMTCITEMGSIDVKSLYSEGATFKTVSGDVSLGQGHGQICVVGERTNLHIESLEGDLDVGIQQGSVNAHLSRHNKVDVDMDKGDISLSFPEGTNSDLVLSSPSVSVDEKLVVRFHDAHLPHHKEGHVGERGVAQVNARTLSGNIHLKVLDWIQATKLLFSNRQTTD